MVAVIQRVRQASVTVKNQVIAHINRGLVILLGAAQGDTGQDVSFMVEKIPRLRFFPDAQGKMTDALQDINGELLLISQFTFLANTEKGRRPSFELATPPEEARVRSGNTGTIPSPQSVCTSRNIWGDNGRGIGK